MCNRVFSVALNSDGRMDKSIVVNVISLSASVLETPAIYLK